MVHWIWWEEMRWGVMRPGMKRWWWIRWCIKRWSVLRQKAQKNNGNTWITKQNKHKAHTKSRRHMFSYKISGLPARITKLFWSKPIKCKSNEEEICQKNNGSLVDHKQNWKTTWKGYGKEMKHVVVDQRIVDSTTFWCSDAFTGHWFTGHPS